MRPAQNAYCVLHGENLNVQLFGQTYMQPFTSCLLQVEEEEASITGRLFKFSLTIMAGAASVYYINVRNPSTIPTILSRIRLPTL